MSCSIFALDLKKTNLVDHCTSRTYTGVDIDCFRPASFVTGLQEGHLLMILLSSKKRIRYSQHTRRVRELSHWTSDSSILEAVSCSSSLTSTILRLVMRFRETSDSSRWSHSDVFDCFEVIQWSLCDASYHKCRIFFVFMRWYIFGTHVVKYGKTTCQNILLEMIEIMNVNNVVIYVIWFMCDI